MIVDISCRGIFKRRLLLVPAGVRDLVGVRRFHRPRREGGTRPRWISFPASVTRGMETGTQSEQENALPGIESNGRHNVGSKIKGTPSEI